MDVNEAPIDEAGGAPSYADEAKGRPALGGLPRELSREELKESGAQKMILARLDDLEDNVAELSEFRDEYYRVDKEVAVLRERVKRSTTFELLYGVVLVTGPLLIGLAPSVSSWLALPGGLLLIGAIVARLLWPSTATGGAP